MFGVPVGRGAPGAAPTVFPSLAALNLKTLFLPNEHEILAKTGTNK